MPKLNFIKKVTDSFKDNSNIILDEKEKKYADRLLAILDIKLPNLIITDHELYKQLKKKYPFISFTQVCNDIAIVERMIVSEKDKNGDAKKVWHRYFIVETAKEALAIARKKGDAYTMGFLLNIIGKHNLTDKEDVTTPPFEDIIPFTPIITSDVSIVGKKPIKELEILKAKLRAKYNLDNHIIDVIPEPTDEED